MGRFSSPSSPCFTTKSESRGTDLRSRHRVELSRRSAKLTEELLNLVGERGGLLHGCEMAALFHLDDVQNRDHFGHAAGPPRFKLPITLATLDVTADGLRPVIHELVS